jgi:hypothetical protein
MLSEYIWSETGGAHVSFRHFSAPDRKLDFLTVKPENTSAG